MEKIFLQFVNQSISAGWIILAIIPLRILLKKAPRWIICIFWGIVGLRLELPFAIKSYFSLVPSTDTVPTTFSNDVVPKIHTGIDFANSAINPILQNQYDKAQMDSLFQSTYPPKGDNSFVQLLSAIAHIGAVVWIIGIGLMLLYMLISYIKIYRKIRTATHFKDNIYESECVFSPFIFGIFMPRIYIPYNLSGSDFSNVIAHEKAHISRHDPLVKIIGYIILSLYWFNPLIWVAYALLCRDIEFATDEKVIKKLDKEERKAYLYALLNSGVAGGFNTASPVAFGEVGVKERVLKIKFYKKTSFWLIGLTIFLCVTLAFCFLTSPDLQQASQNIQSYDDMSGYITCPATTVIPEEIERLAQREENKKEKIDGEVYTNGKTFFEKALADVDGDRENELVCRVIDRFRSYMPPDWTIFIYDIEDNSLKIKEKFILTADSIREGFKKLSPNVEIDDFVNQPTLSVFNNNATVLFRTDDTMDTDTYYNVGIKFTDDKLIMYKGDKETEIKKTNPKFNWDGSVLSLE